MRTSRILAVVKLDCSGWFSRLAAILLLAALLMPCVGPHMLAPSAVVPIQHHHGGTDHGPAPDNAADGLHCLVQPLTRDSTPACAIPATAVILTFRTVERAAGARLTAPVPSDEFLQSVLSQTGTLHQQSILFRV